jgi:hypothetical protein
MTLFVLAQIVQEKPQCGGGIQVTVLEEKIDNISRYYLEFVQTQYGLDTRYRVPVGHPDLINDMITMLTTLQTQLAGLPDINWN